MNKRNNPNTRSKRKALPPDAALLDDGIDPANFARLYRVVTCPLCKRIERSQFLFLLYVGPDTKGEQTARAYLGIYKPGLNSRGEPRTNWITHGHGSDFNINCDLKHITTLTARGKIECRTPKHNEDEN